MDKDIKYYLAGPMSGIDQHNIPAFDEATQRLRAQGYTLISPAELDGGAFRKEAMKDSPDMAGGATCLGHTYGELLSRDVQTIADTCGGIILLPGWHKSRGARLEAYIGLAWGLRFGTYHFGSVVALSNRFVAGVVAKELVGEQP
ncbi:hypothetical protein LCGC14_0808370 [marine sediment metagenome]|uniref:Nucleoside 2-deoxyribosyltransferase n=1 Tax=marine sediment metagenome TaxID=412755 RepID=A0A0F9PMF2_9ZZZZ